MIYAYIRLSDLMFPINEGDIRLEYPDIPENLFGDIFPCPDGYAPVILTEPADYNQETQTIACNGAHFVNDRWETLWQITNIDFDLAEKTEALYQKMLDSLKPKKPKQDLTLSGSTPNVIG